ncbi:hypothetical protein V6Z11_1Z001100 [Gossypium hirsutum]
MQILGPRPSLSSSPRTTTARLAVRLSSLKTRPRYAFVNSFLPPAAGSLPLPCADLQGSLTASLEVVSSRLRVAFSIIEDIALKAIEHSSLPVLVLVPFLRDVDSDVVKQSIVSGRNFFCCVLEEMALQFQQNGKVDQCLEELWIWMVRFKDGVFSTAMEPGPLGAKLLSLKFLETYVLLFTSDNVDSANFLEATRGSRQTFSVSWLSGGHPILDPVALTSDANRTLFILLGMLQSASSLPVSVTITIVNCLAAIARKRPLHYGTVLSALLDFNPNCETLRGCHYVSIQFSLRTAFLGFLRCTYPAIVESRERLLRALRAMNAGDAADQVIRQVEKIKNSERASRETRSSSMVSKCIRSGSNSHPIPHAQINDSGQDFASVNGQSPSFPLSDGNLTAVEQMISMAERGAESLEILISKIHSDLLADIVITNMSHLPKSPPPLTSFGTLLITKQTDYVNSVTQAVQPPGPTNSLDAPVAQLPSTSAATTSSSISDISIVNIAAETKRDPRRDPRRLDPRQAAVSVGVSSLPVLEDTGTAMAEFDGSISIKPLSVPVVENLPVHLTSNVQSYDKVIEGPSVSAIKQPAPEGDVLSVNEDIVPILEVNTSSNCALSPPGMVDQNAAEMKVDAEAKHEIDASSFPESEENYLASTTISSLDETGRDLPVLPLYGHKIVLHILYHLYSFTVSNADDTSSYSGVIYEKFLLAVAKYLLDTFPASDKSFSRLLGEVPFLPDSALKLLDDLCCFNVFDATRKETRDAERVMQGLGVVWSLILGRPNNRQACLSKALKHHRIHFALSLVFMHDFPLFIVFLSLLPVPPWQSAVNSQDDIRGKAIQLVANKLYQLDYISGEIEQFATNMLLSADDRHAAGAEFLHSGSADERGEMEVRSGYTSTTGSQFQEPRVSGIDSMIAESTTNSASVVSFAEAQRLISLVFSLCTKKPSLLQFLFDVYGRAPKTVKQVFHRHIPIVIRALGQSCSQLLQIISDPPQGSENLLTLVLQILTQETIPSPDLVATVKYLYETKLKDATILIPILSSLSKNEVLPIFPRRVDLPLEKFQLALAHILQGSAHIGPALTPAKALVAIHDIIPEKGGLPHKKITDACSACFEQRTVFTQQVLAKALNQMVDQIPLPLLFMRTVIQAIDAFPTMVWRMPKLWVGFLKCVAQTQPHSFPVLLQLPPPQLESALNKYGSLRSSLAAYKNQPTRKGSLPRSTLAVLHLANESHMQQPHVSTLHPSDTSSAQVATLA